MVSISDLFGWTGAFISICFFCYPIINFVKLIKKKITYKDVNIIIILGNYISSIVWLIYGYKISCTQLIVCYSIGAFISLVWLWIYLIHMGKQKMTLTLIYALFLSVLTFGLYIVLAIIIDDKDTLGEVCFIVCSLSYISPTQLIIKVLNKKDYRIIPIISAIISSLGFGSWTFFGLFQFSATIIIPNLVGFIFSGAQIVLYRVYKNKKPLDEEIGNISKSVIGAVKNVVDRTVEIANNIKTTAQDENNNESEINKGQSNKNVDINVGNNSINFETNNVSNNNNGENNNMINDDKDNNFKKTKLISLQDKIFYNEEKNELEKSNDNITNNEININHIKITNKENKDTENNIKEQYSVDYYRENLFNLLTKLNESIPLNKIPDFLKRAFSMDDSIYSESFYFKGIFPKIIISKNSKGVITGICSFYYESNEDLNENLTLRINTIIVGDDYEDQIIEMVNYIKTEVECDKIVIYILYDKIEDKFVSNAEAKNIFVNKLKFKWLCVVRNEKLNQRYIKYCFIKNEKKYELNGHGTTDAINALKHNKNNFLMNNLLIASINTEQNAQLLTEILSNKICFNKYINPNQIYFLLISNEKIKSEFKDQKKFDELNKILGKIKKYSTFDNNYGKELENENKYIKEEIDKSIYGEIKEVLVKKNINCFTNTSSTKLSLNFETNYSTIIDENYYNRISTEKIKVFEESKTGAKFYLIPSKDNNILFYICELNNNLSNLMIDNDKNVYEKFLEFQPSAQKQIFEFSLKSIRDLSYIPMANKTSAKTIYIPCFSIKTHLFSYKFKEIEKNVKLSDIDTNENLKMTSIDEFINVEFKPDNNIKNSFTTVEGYDYIIKNSFIIGIFDNDIINNEKLPLLQFLYINKDEFLTKSNCNI